MATDMLRLELPEPDDGHPLDWYPGDEPEERTAEEANRWVDETLTRSEGVVKLSEARQVLATPTGPYTTTPAREIVMPSQRTTRRRGLAVEPRVYFMRCFRCSLVKIGFSRDFRVRRAELERSTGHVLQILGIQRGDRVIEQRVHSLFGRERVKGEWFRCSERLLAYIERSTTLASGMPRPGRRLV
jgi:hypothetical protein